jgi:hypothetical protein
VHILASWFTFISEEPQPHLLTEFNMLQTSTLHSKDCE